MVITLVMSMESLNGRTCGVNLGCQLTWCIFFTCAHFVEMTNFICTRFCTHQINTGGPNMNSWLPPSPYSYASKINSESITRKLMIKLKFSCTYLILRRYKRLRNERIFSLTWDKAQARFFRALPLNRCQRSSLYKGRGKGAMHNSLDSSQLQQQEHSKP